MTAVASGILSFVKAMDVDLRSIGILGRQGILTECNGGIVKDVVNPAKRPDITVKI